MFKNDEQTHRYEKHNYSYASVTSQLVRIHRPEDDRDDPGEQDEADVFSGSVFPGETQDET